jgi:hypothetical protein
MKLTERGLVSVASSALKVGDIVVIEKGMRAPADVVLLRTTDTSGASFIRYRTGNQCFGADPDPRMRFLGSVPLTNGSEPNPDPTPDLTPFFSGF